MSSLLPAAAGSSGSEAAAAPLPHSVEPAGRGTGDQVTTDPTKIRALAHPIRLSLLEYLDSVPQATATECAAAVGESVASCSFHLRTLAKHGYIERVEASGREKPWRTPASSRSQDLDPEAPGSLHALASLAALTLERQGERLRGYLRQVPALPVEDAQLATILTASFYATDDELRELRERLQDLVAEFKARTRNPDLRPEGARKAHLFATLNLDPGTPA